MSQAFTLPSRRRLNWLTAGFILSSSFVATSGQAQELTIDASASVGAASNPYQRTGKTSSSLSSTLDLRPTWTMDRPLTTLRLEGDLSATFYSKEYSTNESILLRGSGTQKISEYTTIIGELGYTNSIGGSVRDVRVPVGALLADTQLPGFINDPALGGIGRRFQSYQGLSGIRTLLSPRDRVMGDVSVSANRYSQGNLQDFNYVAPSVGYSRAIGENFDVGVNAAVSFSDYLHTPIGDSTVYLPSLTTSLALEKGWTAQGSVGAAIARIEGDNGDNRSSTTLNGSVALCKRDLRWNLCVNAARQTVPSAFEGVRSQNNLSVVAGYRANLLNNFSLVASYSHSSGPLARTVIANGFNGTVDFVSASGNYSHRFTRVVSGFVSAGYAKTYGTQASRNSNLFGSVGISYAIGAPR